MRAYIHTATTIQYSHIFILCFLLLSFLGFLLNTQEAGKENICYWQHQPNIGKRGGRKEGHNIFKVCAKFNQEANCVKKEERRKIQKVVRSCLPARLVGMYVRVST